MKLKVVAAIGFFTMMTPVWAVNADRCAALSAAFMGNSDFSATKADADRLAMMTVDQLRSGAVADYLELQFGNQTKRYISLANVLAGAMEIHNPVVLTWDTQELKFLPNVQLGTDLILIAGNQAPLESSKAQAVIATAQRLKVSIHTVLVYDRSSAAEQMIQLSRATGGSVLDLRSVQCSAR